MEGAVKSYCQLSLCMNHKKGLHENVRKNHFYILRPYFNQSYHSGILINAHMAKSAAPEKGHIHHS